MSLKKSSSEQQLSSHAKGQRAEDCAAAWLSAEGYTIVERNFRVRGGEIDIIAFKDETLVFVEVKSLPHGDIDKK